MKKATIYRDRPRRKWRWQVADSNGHKLANSGQGYVRREHCIKMLEPIMDGYGITEYTDQEYSRKVARCAR